MTRSLGAKHKRRADLLSARLVLPGTYWDVSPVTGSRTVRPLFSNMELGCWFTPCMHDLEVGGVLHLSNFTPIGTAMLCWQLNHTEAGCQFTAQICTTDGDLSSLN